MASETTVSHGFWSCPNPCDNTAWWLLNAPCRKAQIISSWFLEHDKISVQQSAFGDWWKIWGCEANRSAANVALPCQCGPKSLRNASRKITAEKQKGRFVFILSFKIMQLNTSLQCCAVFGHHWVNTAIAHHGIKHFTAWAINPEQSAVIFCPVCQFCSQAVSWSIWIYLHDISYSHIPC